MTVGVRAITPGLHAELAASAVSRIKSEVSRGYLLGLTHRAVALLPLLNPLGYGGLFRGQNLQAPPISRVLLFELGWASLIVVSVLGFRPLSG